MRQADESVDDRADADDEDEDDKEQGSKPHQLHRTGRLGEVAVRCGFVGGCAHRG